MFCSRCHRSSLQDYEHLLGRRRRHSAVVLHCQADLRCCGNPNASRSQKTKIRARHSTCVCNDETFSAIADRMDERESCEQEVSGQIVGQRRPRARPRVCGVDPYPPLPGARAARAMRPPRARERDSQRAWTRARPSRPTRLLGSQTRQ